jgi:hypothetical protein
MITRTLRWARRVTATLAAVTLGLLLLLPAGHGGADAGLRLAAAPVRLLVVETVPPVAGFPVTADGVTVLTDAAGQAHFDLPMVTDVPVAERVALTEATVVIDGLQVIARSDRLLPSTRLPRLTLDLNYPVQFRFLGIDDTPIDPSEIGRVTVKSETGQVLDVDPAAPNWLQGSRVVRQTGYMEIRQLMWRVVHVEYSGVNAVNASQQQFFPAARQDVDVRLLFFELRLHVYDAIYGSDAGDEIELRYPDGTASLFPLDDGGQLTLPAVPRGDYVLVVHGSGPPVERPLAVSRDQDVDIGFHTWLDVLTVVGGALGLAVALAWAGRVRRRRTVADDLPPQDRPRYDGRHRSEVDEPATPATAAPASDEVEVLAGRSDRELTG